jgi:hypothetical protein
MAVSPRLPHQDGDTAASAEGREAAPGSDPGRAGTEAIAIAANRAGRGSRPCAAVKETRQRPICRRPDQALPPLGPPTRPTGPISQSETMATIALDGER